VAILADQNAPITEGYERFFGVSASTYSAYARVLVASGCSVLFTVCLRNTFGFGFRMESRLLEVPVEGDREQRAKALVRTYLDAVEAAARRHPEQYLWMHRRWKNRPEGMPSVYATTPAECTPPGR
jgi:KDO2-lipid IV(A) lauroyltransferase